MKNFLLSLVFLFGFVSMSAAENPVVLTSGNLSAMKSAGTAVVVFDYSKATVIDGKSTTTWAAYSQSRGDGQAKWELAVKNTEGAFVKKLVKSVKPMLLTTEGSGDYRLTVRFTKIDFGDIAAGIVSSLTVFGSSKSGGARFTGEVVMTDNRGKHLCTLAFNEAKGDRAETNQLRFTVGMLDLASYIGKLVKKAPASTIEVSPVTEAEKAGIVTPVKEVSSKRPANGQTTPTGNETASQLKGKNPSFFQIGKWSVWWGLNTAAVAMDGGSSKNTVNALNIGGIYSVEVENYAIDLGAGFVSKGGKGWNPTYLQLNFDGNYKFVRKEKVGFGAFAGPYMGFMLLKDGAGSNANIFDLGFNLGACGNYRKFFAKIGFEYGVCNCLKGGKNKPWDFFLRIGYTF